jgi:hypothetical protein
MSFYHEQQIIKRYIGDLIPILKENNAILAGGAITSVFTNTIPNDFDIFFRCEQDYSKVHKHFESLSRGGILQTKKTSIQFDRSPPIYTKRASTHKVSLRIPDPQLYGVEYTCNKTNLQLVNPMFISGSPKDVINTFDFTVCQGAYDFNSEMFELGGRFLCGIASRQLICILIPGNIPFTPINTLFRARKYEGKGFSCDASQYLKICIHIMGLRLETYHDFFDQTVNVADRKLILHIKEVLISEHGNSEVLSEKINWERVIELINDYVDHGLFSEQTLDQRR